MSSLRLRKRRIPNIVRGGRAISLDNNGELYYLQGRSHAQGGIDIGENPRTGIEAEGGEIVQMKPNELRVLSAQDFIGGGVSPAKQVLAGADPDKVFNEQERFKDRHRLNDDGSKYKEGGSSDNQDSLNNKPVTNKELAWDIVKLLDPTGITSYNDVKRAFNDYKDNPIDLQLFGNLLFETAGALPVIGKIGKIGKLPRLITKWGRRAKLFNKAPKVAGDIDMLYNDGEITKGLAYEAARNSGGIDGIGFIIGSAIDDKPYTGIYNDKSNKNVLRLSIYGDETGFRKSRIKESLIDTKNNNVIGDLNKYYYHSMYPYKTIDIPKNKKDVIDNNVGNIIRINGDMIETKEPILDYKDASLAIKSPNKARLFDVWDQSNSVLGRALDFATRPTDKYNSGIPTFINEIPIRYVDKNNQNSKTFNDMIILDDNFKNQFNQKRNGGMIATINGNVKNGLITTPRKKCGGRRKAEGGLTTTTGRRGTLANDTWETNVLYSPELLDYYKNIDLTQDHARQDAYFATKNTVNFDPSGDTYDVNKAVLPYQQWFARDAQGLFNNINNNTVARGNTGNWLDNRWSNATEQYHTGINLPRDVIVKYNEQLKANNRYIANDLENNMTKVYEMPELLKAPNINVPQPVRPDLSPIGRNSSPIGRNSSPTGGQAKTPQSSTPRRRIKWNNDLTSLVANGLGFLGAFGADLWGTNLRSWEPYLEAPVKLKTNWNINPQLDRIRESSQEAYRDIDANTASSSTALVRKQRVRNQAQYAANEQWGTKENKETELINKDKLNRQSVRNRNTNRLNYWAESDANIANMRRRLRGAAWSSLFDNLNKTVQGYIGRRDQRRRDEAIERMFNRAYPHGAAMARNIQSRESSGDATIPSLATNPIAVTGRLATKALDDEIVAKTKKRYGGKIKRK